jgi:hypothetical protein
MCKICISAHKTKHRCSERHHHQEKVNEAKWLADFRCVFKEKTDVIIELEESPIYGHVGCVIGYTSALQVIFHIRGEMDDKLMSFFDAAPLKMSDAWPVSHGRPRMGSRVFVVRGQCVGLMGRVIRLEPRRSTMVVTLDAMDREVILHKGGGATGNWGG